MSSSKGDINQPDQPTGTQPPNSGAAAIQVFDENNPGPSFEEIFPEYAYADEFDDFEENGKPYEYFLQECENCTCCQGFIYNCDGIECNKEGTCFCAAGKEIQPAYFNVHMS